MKFLRGFAVGIFGLWVLACILLVIFQRSLMYAPDTNKFNLAGSGISQLQEIQYSAGDGLVLSSGYVPAQTGKPTILMFHGNAGNIDRRISKAKVYSDLGYGVLLAEYRGYGGNPGAIDEAGLIADAQGAWDFLKAKGLEDNIILYGESLGTGVATQLAARHTPLVLILESPYDNFAKLVAAKVPWFPMAEMFVHDKFDSLNFIPMVKAPIFIVHGQKDQLIPIARAKRLFEAANLPKEMVILEEGHHNDLYSHGAGQAIVEFLGKFGA